MKNWLENYERQIVISGWIFLYIFVAIIMMMIVCISWRVWCTANENPAEVIKSE
ncbi:hypothetical protein [Bacteroides cutis]|jgi:hypothetical protein|uniref:hypothetical protein n=1 Tax=Bacteroides cutis TaxID=2024197 RepID=UPI0023A8A659|nr:hypothetical protein [Bacteroides cutis]